MKKLLQIDACLNWGSTGRITEDIAKIAIDRGWSCYIIHGSRYVNYPSVMQSYKPGSIKDEFFHYAEHFFFDNDGLASRRVTKLIVKRIKEINPNIIQLHDIHDHWLNYRILFEYLNTLDIPIVWTQHDCWSFTGDCGHFTSFGCERWKEECTEKCPFRHKPYIRHFISRSNLHYIIKKKLFTSSKNLTLISVSHWLECVLRDSFLKEKPIRTIYNGVDTRVFRPLKNVTDSLCQYGLMNIKYVVGVATAWSDRKGFSDYCKLATMLGNEVKIVLVGLDKKRQAVASRYGIIGIARTENVKELVDLYNGASIVMNLSYEETFGLTTVEGLACGTPGIVYNITASPELITQETGIIVEPGDVEGVAAAIRLLISKVKPIKACRERAINFFDKNDRYQDYINLYEKLRK